ncbi:SWIB-domain-containing protein [Rhodofomes roseus]|uniref:SWIB-domain-containing protein n=1 Tax=Rhodofomes roseus TaxID=34475 RepID=A0ABQ8K9Q7_9APHY|nr:SWIB-domain-containing protein [Rhodofomes roseus]KAH9833999.1 SWIB-domain-containing protein [Rhodofomes roseus]
MSADIQRYEPHIRHILNAPGVDLTTISAKRVRKQLVEMDDSLTAEFVREHKDGFDSIIASVYEEVSAAQANDSKGKRRSRDDEEEEGYANGDGDGGDEGDEGDEGEEEVEVKPKKAKRAKKGSLTDEEMARQLDSEINGRQRSSRASSTSTRGRGRGGKRGGKRGAKSSATVNSDGETVDDAGEVVKKKRGGGGFKKEYVLSEPLVAVAEVDKLSRPQTVKKLWEYIRRNNLQNPENKREIICDDKFRALFNVEKIDMFTMNKQLGRHLREPDVDPEA